MSKATTVTTAALGVFAPWSTPVRLLAARRAVSRVRSSSRVSRRRGRRRTPVVIGVVGAVTLGVAAAAVVRARTATPPPVAASPPRVEDVPTADAGLEATASE